MSHWNDGQWDRNARKRAAACTPIKLNVNIEEIVIANML